MERLLNIKELAELLNVPISWVYARTEKACKEPIPVVRMGKKGRLLRFRESEIEAWLEKKERSK